MSKMSKTLMKYFYWEAEIELVREEGVEEFLWLCADKLQVRVGGGNRIDERLTIPFCDAVSEWCCRPRSILREELSDWLEGEGYEFTTFNSIFAVKSWLVSSHEAGLDTQEGRRLRKTKGGKILLGHEQVGLISNGVTIFDKHVDISSTLGISAGAIAIKGKFISKR